MRYPEDAIMAAAFLFEEANGNPPGEMERAEIERHGLSGIATDLLARELQHAIRSESKSDATYRRQAYWALGRKFDPALLEFFRESLARELKRDGGAVFQILIALDNLKEPVFSAERGGSYSSLDDALNQKDAASYLERIVI